MQCALILMCFVLIMKISAKWIHENNQTCSDFHFCTPSGYTWRNSETSITYNKASACAALIDKGYSMLSFVGDSYIRHIFQAFIILLTDDYDTGILVDKSRVPHEMFSDCGNCHGHNQFNSYCSNSCANTWLFVCENKILLDSTIFSGPPGIHDCDNPFGKAIFWGEGNHPVDHDYDKRTGVNNASIWIKHFEQNNYGPCNNLSSTTTNKCPLWWISTHQRYSYKFSDEKHERIEEFNEEMKDYFSSGRCGVNTRFIDVFNMTHSLVKDFPEDSSILTLDGAHWGLEVNVMKAQLILNELIQKPMVYRRTKLRSRKA